MPFNKHRGPVVVNAPVIIDKLEQTIDENGVLHTESVRYDASAHASETPSYKNYSLRAQLEAGDQIKRVNTSILSDDLDGITCAQVANYFDNDKVEPNETETT